jgi:hypothetical protein
MGDGLSNDIASGRLKRGQRLPTHRALAQALRIDLRPADQINYPTIPRDTERLAPSPHRGDAGHRILGASAGRNVV